MNKINIAFLFGGRSDEHTVSIISTKYVYSLLKDFGHNVSCFYFDR